MVKENSIVLNGQPLYYRVEGNGLPVVLVHGFSEDGTVWDNQVAALKDKYQLIIPDLPGSGRSPLNDAEWSMEYFADCIRLILDQEKIQTVSMIGHSMGGLIVQRAILEADMTRRISHLALFGTPSAGLRKAGLGSIFKRQARDMAAGGAFVTKLRADWTQKFQPELPFAFRAIAGGEG